MGNKGHYSTCLQGKILQSLHENHPGISRMKAIARSYFWWNGLDKHIEDIAKSCPSCQAVKSTPSLAPLHPWLWPDAPWTRIHIDFARVIHGQNVPHYCGYPFKVARGHCYVHYRDSEHHRVSTFSFFTFQSSRTIGIRQWTSIYI